MKIITWILPLSLFELTRKAKKQNEEKHQLAKRHTVFPSSRNNRKMSWFNYASWAWRQHVWNTALVWQCLCKVSLSHNDNQAHAVSFHPRRPYACLGDTAVSDMCSLSLYLWSARSSHSQLVRVPPPPPSPPLSFSLTVLYKISIECFCFLFRY